MKMKYIAILAVALAGGCATTQLEPWSTCVPGPSQSDGFTLTDGATGKVLGPFPLTNGTPIVIESTTLVLNLSDSRTAELERKLKAASMPELDFRNAKLVDVFEFFSACSAHFDCEHQSYITFILMGKGTASRTVTLRMQDTNLFDAFTVVCDMLALTYKLDPREVVFIAPKEGKHITFHDEQLSPPYSERAADDPF
jgi:hypothetical protein